MDKRTWLLSSTALVATFSFGSGGTWAADYLSLQTGLPAVSAINGKFELRGGVDKNLGEFIGIGSLSIPLGQSFGAQFDGLIGTYGGAVAAGAGTHLFWRDPSRGLLGGYADVVYNGAGATSTIARGAIEGEAYLDRFTLKAVAGFQSGGNAGGFFDKLTVDYYPTDNLILYAGHRYLPQTGHFGAIGAEYLTNTFSASGLALFAEGRLGQNSYAAALGGARMYFGPAKSLISRHREDDPVTLFDLVLAAAPFVPVETPE